MTSKFVPPKITKKVERQVPELESLRKLRALKERISREYEQEKREREMMENNEPIMPMSLASEKSLLTTRDGPKSPSTQNHLHPAQVGYGAGHVPLSQDPADFLKEKLHQLKGSNKTWQSDLEAELGSKFNEMSQLKSQNRRLREILTLREASNSRKEARLESEIVQLKNLMDDVCLDSREHEDTISKLRNMNYEIQEKADLLKSTIEEQAEAERLALIRTYRVRIRDVKQQLANQESLNLEGAKAWIARFEMLERDRADADAHLKVIEAQNQTLRESKTEIRVMHRHQEEQRKDLTQKIALVKRENKRFEEHIARLEKQLSEPVEVNTLRQNISQTHRSISRGATPSTHNKLFMTTGISRTQTPATGISTDKQASNVSTVELTSVPQLPKQVDAQGKVMVEVIEQQQSEAITKIRKVLETIRNALKQVRSAHIELLQERTELEIFLRKCIDDVRKDMYRAVSSSDASKAGSKQGTSSISAKKVDEDLVLLQQYGVQERRQLMDILNSKLQLLTVLHQTMFPHKSLPEAFGSRLAALGRSNGDLDQKEIMQSLQFENDVDTLWQRWQSWVRTESPTPNFAGN